MLHTFCTCITHAARWETANTTCASHLHYTCSALQECKRHIRFAPAVQSESLRVQTNVHSSRKVGEFRKMYTPVGKSASPENCTLQSKVCEYEKCTLQSESLRVQNNAHSSGKVSDSIKCTLQSESLGVINAQSISTDGRANYICCHQWASHTCVHNRNARDISLAGLRLGSNSFINLKPSSRPVACIIYAATIRHVPHMCA